jgi:hypothetical protein
LPISSPLLRQPTLQVPVDASRFRVARACHSRLDAIANGRGASNVGRDINTTEYGGWNCKRFAETVHQDLQPTDGVWIANLDVMVGPRPCRHWWLVSGRFHFDSEHVAGIEDPIAFRFIERVFDWPEFRALSEGEKTRFIDEVRDAGRRPPGP